MKMFGLSADLSPAASRMCLASVYAHLGWEELRKWRLLCRHQKSRFLRQ